MKAFAELYNRLDETKDVELRVNALVDFLNQASNEDQLKAIALLTDQRPSRIVTLAQIKSWGMEAANLPEWLFEESLKSVGDIGETVSLVIPVSNQTTDESLSFWLNHIESISKMDEEGKKAGVIEAWNLLDPNSRFIFNKLIAGGLRTVYPQILLTRAISKYTGKDIAVIADRLISKWNPKKIDFDELFLEPKETDQHTKFYPFFSAHYLEKKPDELGNPEDWIAEYKWDGVRVQVVKRADEIWVWTKDSELITLKTPELNEVFQDLSNGTVFDGELLAYKNESPLPLKILMQRLRKKKVTKKLLHDVPLAFMAYDILEHKNKDIRNLPWTARRKKLEKSINQLTACTSIKISPIHGFNDWSKLSRLLNTARSNQACGMVIKKQMSNYGEGRAKDWWKWQVPKMTVLTVLLYAQSGGWAGGESNFTFAVWQGDNLIPITKSYVGLSKEELTEIGKFVKMNTIEKFGPVRSVKPELIFELSFDGIDHSSRHKCGLVLRNPTILKWRKEFTTTNINALEELKALLIPNE